MDYISPENGPKAYKPTLCPKCGYVWDQHQAGALGRRYCPSCISAWGEYIVGVEVVVE